VTSIAGVDFAPAWETCVVGNFGDVPAFLKGLKNLDIWIRAAISFARVLMAIRASAFGGDYLFLPAGDIQRGREA